MSQRNPKLASIQCFSIGPFLLAFIHYFGRGFLFCLIGVSRERYRFDFLLTRCMHGYVYRSLILLLFVLFSLGKSGS